MSSAFYESERALSEYLLFHYGTCGQILSLGIGPMDALDFPRRCVQELRLRGRALDLGCAVGGASFELARGCMEVVGIDFSRRFIDVATHLQRQGSIHFSYLEEGEITCPAQAIIPADIPRERVSFEVGDVQQLRADLEGFDVVLMANLIDRLREPLRCLERLPRLVKTGGQLLITSPYTWLEDYTPKQHWLAQGELKNHLAAAFSLVTRKDLPFLIREHARKFQWSIAEATLWERKS